MKFQLADLAIHKSVRCFTLAALLTGLGLGLGTVLLAPSTSLAKPPAEPLSTQSQAADETPAERAKRLRELAEERRRQREAELAERSAEVIKMYNEMSAAYLANDMEKTKELYRPLRPKMGVLDRDKQNAIRQMYKMADEYRPDWWAGTKKEEKNSFKAGIWGRDFWANYVPTRELGLQAVYPEREYNRKTGEYEVTNLIILVTWKPLMVDSPKQAEGRLAKENGYTFGDLAEIIVWHELGHNYITEQVPLKANLELYNKYDKLYSALHEYYADMTALYHCTPRARRVVLQFRLDGLDYYQEDQEHRRGSHGIGAIVLADMLMNPDKWPSVNFPPKVPEKQVELNTIIYVYENLGRDNWTVEEDVRLQELAEEYVLKQGERTFKSKGTITLPNRLQYKLLVSEDRENQKKRDAWVAEKLSDLRDAGRLDTMEQAGGKYDPPHRIHTRARSFHGDFKIEINGKTVSKGDDKDAPKRIEIPWEY